MTGMLKSSLQTYSTGNYYHTNRNKTNFLSYFGTHLAYKFIIVLIVISIINTREEKNEKR